MSLAVTVPPEELIFRMTALILESPRALLSWATTCSTVPGFELSSPVLGEAEIIPFTGIIRIFSSPFPSSVNSLRGSSVVSRMLILGVEQAPSSNNTQKAASIEKFLHGLLPFPCIVQLPSANFKINFMNFPPRGAAISTASVRL